MSLKSNHPKLAASEHCALIEEMLQTLNISADRPLMIHAGFREAGALGLDPTITAETLAAKFAHGAVMMPTMSWRAVNSQHPYFDEFQTPSITGILGETHSAAGFGRSAQDLLATHYLDDTPCSIRSPYGQMLAAEGNVLLFGVGIRYCTLLHHFEERFAPELYLVPPEQAERYICRRRDGCEIEVILRRHLRIKRNFWRIGEIMLTRGVVKRWGLGGLEVTAFKATDLASVVDEELSRNPAGLLAEMDDPRSHY